MITDRKMTPTIDYPAAVEFMEQQSNVFWTAHEIDVGKDKHDILVNMTDAERHAVITTLKLFTKYEMIIGEEYWLTKIMQKYPRPEIQAMASLFGAVELSVHSPFYRKINEELNLATDEFYSSYTSDPVLSARMKWLDNKLDSNNWFESLITFVFLEGAVLYASFAFLKHFQSAGKNKLLNVVSGINFSARDEALHSEAAAWLFQQHLSELGEAPVLYLKLIEDIAEQVLEHEIAIIDKLFEEGPIEGITKKQLVAFVKSRLNVCAQNMGLSGRLYDVDYNPLAEDFYKGINGFSANDFFSSVGNQYQRDWNESGFNWSKGE